LATINLKGDSKMAGRKKDKSYLFTDYTISHVGQEDENPEEFGYPKDNPVNTGLSIRVHKVLGMGKFEYIEVALYNQAMEEAVEMDFMQGESITFYGKYKVDKGKKQDFKKVSINLPMQIDRYKGRTAKASEI
jgi:hypothetical protein